MVKKKVKKRKLKKSIYILILIILLIAFSITSYHFITLFIDYQKSKNLASDIEEQIDKNVPIEQKESVTEDNVEDKAIIYTRDFDKLEKINEDTVAWIEVERTNINYPVVQTIDNSYYLTHSFDKSRNVNGWIFLNNENNSDFNDQNTIIFAHNSLFRALRTLYDGNYENDIKITIYQRNQVLAYQVFSVYLADPNNTKVIEIKLDEEQLQYMISLSKIDFRVDVNENDSILTLSTCYNDSSQRIIVHAKKI